jgi:hypothetical protein
MTSGSTLEEIGMLRSVGGFHGVQTISGVFQTPLLLFPGPSMAVGGMVPGSVPGEVA